MKTLSKALAGISAAAMISVAAAAPAEARPRYYGDNDIDIGDVAAGVAIVGGVAAIASAVSNQGYYGGGYRYPPSYGQSYGGGYGYAPGYGQGYGYAPSYNYAPSYGQGYGYGQGYYGQGYGYNSAGSERQAVDMCTREAGRFGARIRDVDDVDYNGGYFVVRGDVYVRDHDDYSYGRPEIDSEDFTCTVAGGQIRDFRISGDNRW